MCRVEGVAACPMSLGLRGSGVLGGRDGRRLSGRGVEFSDPGQDAGREVLVGWQSLGEGAAVSDQAGGDAEQFMAQAPAVGAAVFVDAGQCLEEDREVPGEQRRPHPDLVPAVVPRG